jgi:syntaxin 1A
MKSPSLPPHFTQIIKSSSLLEKVSKSTEKLKSLKKIYSKTASLEEEGSLKQKVRNLVNQNNMNLNKIREISENLSKILEEGKLDSTTERMLRTGHATLLKNFSEAVAASENAQNEFSEYSRMKIAGQLRMVDENIDDETIELCLDDPKLAQGFFDRELIGVHSDVLKMVNSIEDRLQDIKMLEENIVAMHKMFLDLAAIVHGQGDILNSIEKHVDTALDYVKTGTEQIQQAEIQLKAARSKRCCVLVILLIIATVIAMPIIAVKYS